MYNIEIDVAIWKILRLTEAIVTKYKIIARFKVNMHQFFIQTLRNTERKWLPVTFRMEDHEIERIIEEWATKWKVWFDEADILQTTVTQKPPVNLEDF